MDEHLMDKIEFKDYTKRQFYLMAKYVVLTDDLIDKADIHDFMSDEESKELYKEEEEVQNIVDELNTSGIKCKAFSYPTFVFEDDKVITDFMLHIGGEDYPEYDDSNYCDAQAYLAIRAEDDNFWHDACKVDDIFSTMGASLDKAKEYISYIEKSGDKEFLEEKEVDKDIAVSVCKTERNDKFPMDDRKLYLECLLAAEDTYNMLQKLRQNSYQKLLVPEKERINEIVCDAVMSDLERGSFAVVSEDKVKIHWKIHNQNAKDFELKYDGTMAGLSKACKSCDELRKGFLKKLTRELETAIECDKLLPDVIKKVHELEKVYESNNGKKICPDHEKEYKKLCSYLENNTVRKCDLSSFVEKTRDAIRIYGKEKDDTMQYRIKAARRLLQAYKLVESPHIITDDLKDKKQEKTIVRN